MSKAHHDSQSSENQSEQAKGRLSEQVLNVSNSDVESWFSGRHIV